MDVPLTPLYLLNFPSLCKIIGTFVLWWPILQTFTVSSAMSSSMKWYWILIPLVHSWNMTFFTTIIQSLLSRAILLGSPTTYILIHTRNSISLVKTSHACTRWGWLFAKNVFGIEGHNIWTHPTSTSHSEPISVLTLEAICAHFIP